jgi:hypothetical protein
MNEAEKTDSWITFWAWVIGSVAVGFATGRPSIAIATAALLCFVSCEIDRWVGK